MTDAASHLVFGSGDHSFQAAGKEAGIRKLVNDFYDRMAADTRFAPIYAMHPDDKSASRDKLARFLCGWLGGPKLYQEKYGPISIPLVHQHLVIRKDEENQWLTCMREAIAEQGFSEDFKDYLYKQLSIPADVIRARCEQLQQGKAESD